MQKKTFGFTLIELLVVLAIMATLMSIVAPRYFGSVDRAKDAALKTNLRLIRVQIGTLIPALRKNSTSSGPARPASCSPSSTKNRNRVEVMATGRLLTSANAKSRSAPARPRPSRDSAPP